ncbi:MAG: TIGR03086 family metal-binding protein [Candidatus Dormibacteria bacterium]|jgi:uncharacterized protein (TIGR03086 family)
MTTEAPPDALFDAALDQMQALIDSARPDQMTLPTPCTDWDVRALLNHIVGGPAGFVARVSGKTAGWAAPQGDLLGDDPAAAFRAARQTLEATFLEYPEAAGRSRPFIVGESAIHAWDLAQATGQTARLDPALAEAGLVVLRAALKPEMRSSTSFGPEMPVAPDAPPYERLAGFLGRQPLG